MKTNPITKTKAIPGPETKNPNYPYPDLLFFGTTNAKLSGHGVATFSLPAGMTCPGAKECFSYFNRETRKITDGKHTRFRCYAASMEASFSSVRASVDRNLRLLKAARTVEAMSSLIDQSLPAKAWRKIRVHAHGDFYGGDYFLAWMEVARNNPDRLFYAYTKSLPTWIRFMALVPENFVLNASMGGKWDKLIEQHDLKHSIVVFHPEEAEALGIDIDKDDSLAMDPLVKKVGLLLHGTQPAKSKAAAAIKRMDLEDIQYSYGRKKVTSK